MGFRVSDLGKVRVQGEFGVLQAQRFQKMGVCQDGMRALSLNPEAMGNRNPKPETLNTINPKPYSEPYTLRV